MQSRSSSRAVAVVATWLSLLGCSSADTEAEVVHSGAGGAAGSGGGTGATSAGGPRRLGRPGLGGASGATGTEACAPFVSRVVEHAFGPGQNIGQDAFPSNILGPPRGGGCCQGSLDVVSLGNGGHVTVELGATVVDGPGADFIVFENAFFAGGDSSQPFAELASVEVSADGVTWVAFPCTAVAAPYGQCAGWHPVYANADDNDIDPLDPSVAGGDAFDLADVGVSEARFVRITDRADLEGMNGVFDLDAVAAVNFQCP